MSYWAYVTNDGANEVQVVDLLSRQEVARLRVPPGPFGLALTPDHQELWLPCDVTRTLVCLDTAMGELSRSIPLVDPDLVDLCIDPKGEKAYALSARAVLYTLSVASGRVLTVKGLGGAQTERLCLTPDGGSLWITDEQGGQVLIVDIAGSSCIRRITLAGSPADVAFTPDGLKAYVPDLASGVVHVLDAKTGHKQRQITFTAAAGMPRSVAVSPTLPQAYVTLFDADTVAVVDTVDDKVAGVVAGRFDGPNGIAVTPDGKQAVVVNQAGDRTSIVDLTTQREVAAIPFPGNPRRAAIGNRPARLIKEASP